MNKNPITRRAFIHSGAALPAALTVGGRPGHSNRKSHGPEGPARGSLHQQVDELQRVVKLWGDGPSLTPPEYAHLLSQVLSTREVDADYYSNGGVVEELENRMARLLGKERAVFLPTGTLANHLAVRMHARGRTRILVQAESHLYCDSGDCAQVLSNLNLVPMASEDGTFTLRQVEAAVHGAEGGRVPTGVGVISIESPIRRRLGKLFDFGEMARICAFARDQDIATHLDGARLFMASGYTGIPPEAYAAHFDTVYVSLWKYLNAPSGAILAGPHHLLDKLFHDRRMFGGGLPYAWPLAVAALHSLDGFKDRFSAGVKAGKELKAALDRLPGLRVEEIPNGSNIFKLHLEGRDLQDFRQALEERGVEISAPNPNFRGFALVVNETLTRQPVEATLRAFQEAAEA